MDFNPAQHTGLFAALLLGPGMLFMFVLVVYIAFIGRGSTQKRRAARTCLKCGRTLLPEQLECPDCVPQLNPPVAPSEAAAVSDEPEPAAEDVAGKDMVAGDVTGEPLHAEEDAAKRAAAETVPADASAAYEGEIVGEIEEVDDQPLQEHD